MRQTKTHTSAAAASARTKARLSGVAVNVMPIFASSSCAAGMKAFGAELARLRRLLAGLDEDVDQQVGHQRRRDEVEHDRRDDDVAAAPRLQPGRDERPRRAEQRAGQDRERQHDPEGPRAEPERNEPDAEPADVGLALRRRC